MDKTTAIEKVRRYRDLVIRYFPDSEVILFGSYVSNSQRPNSDIDVAVIVDEVKGDYLEAETLLWELRMQIDSSIEPVLFEKRSDPLGFSEQILSEGELI